MTIAKRLKKKCSRKKLHFWSHVMTSLNMLEMGTIHFGGTCATSSLSSSGRQKNWPAHLLDPTDEMRRKNRHWNCSWPIGPHDPKTYQIVSYGEIGPYVGLGGSSTNESKPSERFVSGTMTWVNKWECTTKMFY